MKVTNPGDRVFLAATQQVVEAGATADVPAEVGARLCEQGWKQPAVKKAASTKTATAEQED